EFADRVKPVAWHYYGAGQFTEAQRDHFLWQVERGLEVGIERGLRNRRKHCQFPPAAEKPFRRFGVLCPPKDRLKVCLISQEYPPGDFGGIGRFSADLASGFAAGGHEVHVVTRSPDTNRVDFEEGVWMHRLAPAERHVPELAGVPLAGNLFHAAGVYHEVCRIHRAAPVDMVSAPLWANEGLLCILDERFATVQTLMTSLRTVAGLHPSWDGQEWLGQ